MSDSMMIRLCALQWRSSTSPKHQLAGNRYLLCTVYTYFVPSCTIRTQVSQLCQQHGAFTQVGPHCVITPGTSNRRVGYWSAPATCFTHMNVVTKVTPDSNTHATDARACCFECTYATAPCQLDPCPAVQFRVLSSVGTRSLCCECFIFLDVLCVLIQIQAGD